MTYASPEATWQDALAIASVMANRAQALGVTQQQVVGVQNQFNAYGKSLPAGANIELAQEALDNVAKFGPTTAATFYATPSAVKNLPTGLSQVSEIEGGHQFFEDPYGRAIKTAVGYRAPVDLATVQAAAAQRTAYEVATATEEGMPTPEARPDIATDRVAVAPVPGPVAESWSAMAGAMPVSATASIEPNVTAAASRMGDEPSGLIASPEALTAALSRMNTPAANPIDISRAMDEAIAASVDASAASKTGRLTGNVVAGIDPSRMAGNAPMSDADRALQGMMKEMATPAVIDRFAPHVAPARAFDNITTAGIEPGFSGTIAATGVPARTVQTQTITPGAIDSPEGLAAALGSFPAAMAAQRSVVTPSLASASSLAEGMQAARSVPSEPSVAAESALSTGMQMQRDFSNASASLPPASELAKQEIAPSMTPEQVSGYKEMAQSGFPAGITNLAGTGNINKFGTWTPTAAPTTDFAAEVAAANPGPKTQYDVVRSNVAKLAPDVATPAAIQDAMVELGNVPVPAANPMAVQPATVEVQAPALETIEIAKQPAIAPPVEDMPAVTTSVPSVTKSMPAVQQRQATAMDVWGGKAQTGVATDGSTVSRMDDGRIGRFDPKHNQTMFSDDDGSTWSSPVSGNQLTPATRTPTVQPDLNHSLLSRLVSVLSGISSPTGVATRGTDGGMRTGRDGPAGAPGGWGPGGSVDNSGSAGGFGSTGGKDPEGTY